MKGCIMSLWSRTQTLDATLLYLQDVVATPASNMTTKKASRVPAKIAEVYQDTKKLLEETADPKLRSAIAAVHNLLAPFAAHDRALRPKPYQQYL